MADKRFDPETMAGQRLMVGFDGTKFNRKIVHLIENFKVSGLILFARNVETPNQIRRLCSDAQNCAKTAGLPPLFIAVDQEGGEVARFKAPLFKEYLGNPGIKEAEDVEIFARNIAQDLKGLGINMNLAPVLDVAPQGFDSIMKNRVFQGDAGEVANLGSRYIETLQEAGIMAVAKHFPGIGRTTLDSHLELPVLDSPRDLLEKSDLLPFKSAVSSKVAGMMLSHILYTGLDDRWPASLSPQIAGDLLRNNLGYQGLVMTDDLDMKAIRHDIRTSIGQILLARVDLALICHAGPDIQAAHQTILELISTDQNLKGKSEESLRKIASFKTKFL